MTIWHTQVQFKIHHQFSTHNLAGVLPRKQAKTATKALVAMVETRQRNTLYWANKTKNYITNSLTNFVQFKKKNQMTLYVLQEEPKSKRNATKCSPPFWAISTLQHWKKSTRIIWSSLDLSDAKNDKSQLLKKKTFSWLVTLVHSQCKWKTTVLTD